MAVLTITIEVADDHPWAANAGSLVVADDSAEVIVNPVGFGKYAVAFWQFDEHSD